MGWALLAWARKNWVLLAVIGCVCFYGHLRYNAGQASQKAETKQVQAKFDAFKDAVKAEVERRLVQNGLKEAEDKRVFAEIAQKYKQDKLDAKAKSDAVIAGLRAGTIKLRNQWQGCSVPTKAAESGSGTDENAELRAKDSGDLVRAGSEADSWIQRLQEVIAQLQKPDPVQ